MTETKQEALHMAHALYTKVTQVEAQLNALFCGVKDCQCHAGWSMTTLGEENGYRMLLCRYHQQLIVGGEH